MVATISLLVHGTLASACTSSAGLLDCTLSVSEGVLQLPFGINVTTRLYNGMAPGPVVTAAPGDRVRLLVRNRLGPTTATSSGPMSTMREPNTTNLHVHGIYADATQDNTFVAVLPGHDRLYEYTLHPSSGSALYFYHPHYDGSSGLQLNGGMAGAFVVADPAQEQSLAPAAIATRLLLIQSFNFDPSHADYILTQLANGGTSTMAPRLRQ